jgi:hypothetical protein
MYLFGVIFALLLIQQTKINADPGPQHYFIGVHTGRPQYLWLQHWPVGKIMSRRGNMMAKKEM